jgi:hypothetical protein
VNLTFRQGIAGLARDTWSLMAEPQVRLHAEWFRLYYHLARPHASLREPVAGFKRKYRPRTPAMALGRDRPGFHGRRYPPHATGPGRGVVGVPWNARWRNILVQQGR